MARWMLFFVAIGAITVLAIVFAILTARTIRQEIGDEIVADPADPGRLLGMSRLSLYANAALSQVFMLTLIWITVEFSGVSWRALFVPGALDVPIAVGIGIGLGAGLALINEVFQQAFDEFGIQYDETLRRLLAPSKPTESVALVAFVLPIVAIFEELLFRGALIGAASIGLGISPWFLVIASAIIFALGHGLQGTGGLVGAGILGLVLGGAFVVSESLLLVVVAHYVVNLLEFIRHGGVRFG